MSHDLSQRYPDLALGTGLIGLLATIAIGTEPIGELNRDHPLWSAFLQFGIPSTYGEALSSRIATGSWVMSRLPAKALLWGFIGIWIAIAFPFVASGTNGIIVAGL